MTIKKSVFKPVCEFCIYYPAKNNIITYGSISKLDYKLTWPTCTVISFSNTWWRCLQIQMTNVRYNKLNLHWVHFTCIVLFLTTIYLHNMVRLLLNILIGFSVAQTCFQSCPLRERVVLLSRFFLNVSFELIRTSLVYHSVFGENREVSDKLEK